MHRKVGVTVNTWAMTLQSMVVLALLLSMASCRSRSSEEQLLAATQPNPKLAELANHELAAQTDTLRGPPAKPTAPAAYEAFLATLKSAGTYCRAGQKDPMQSYDKRNYVELQFTFTDGRVASEVYTGDHCGQDAIVMRLDFEKGRVVRATSDGTERQLDPAVARNALRSIAKHLVHYDQTKHAALYYATEEERKKAIDSAWNR